MIHHDEGQQLVARSQQASHETSIGNSALGSGVGDEQPIPTQLEEDSLVDVMPSSPLNNSQLSNRVAVHGKRHARSRLCTVPLWFGCAVLCTVLVALVGFSPFLAGQHNSDVIVAQARNTYNMVFAINGQSMYFKYLNEAITPILAYYQAYNKPQLMVNMNFTDPMWDREWQLFFTGVSATNPERYFYYMDLATGSFTGQYVRGSEKLRIVGHASDVNFTGYVPNRTPPFGYTQASANVTLEFPPLLMFNDFFATGEASFIIQSALGTSGELVYGVASYITTSNLIPVGALMELIPLADMVNLTEPSRADVAKSTETVVLDYLGALVASTTPSLTDIYLPVGTPGAICNTVTYNSRTISKCRHSMETLREVWPLLYVARTAINTRVEGVVNGSFSSVSYVMFNYEDDEYLISASFPILANSGWWTAAITPIDPVYGPYLASRQKILLIVAFVCVGMALFVLFLTYVLMLPLGKLMEQMIAALKLQTQTDRYAKAAAAAKAPFDDTNEVRAPAASATAICGNRHVIEVSELHSIELAVVRLHELLEEVAKMLPPPVILMIRTTIAQRSVAFSNSASSSGSSGIVENSSVSSNDSDSDHDLTPPKKQRLPRSRHHAGDVVQMLAWFEDHYRIRDDESETPTGDEDVPVTPPVQESNLAAVPSMVADTTPTGLRPSHSIDVEGPIEVVALETSAQKRAGKRDHGQSKATTANLNSSGILMNPTVSLRPARRRGFFMAVSLSGLRCEPSQFAEAISPVLSLIWHHRGEVEMIEAGLLLATFGCYENLQDAADSAAACAMAIVEPKPAAKRDAASPALAAAMINRRTIPAPNEAHSPPPPQPFFVPSTVISTNFCVAIDCGWFETSAFSCELPSGRTTRRMLVTSVARDVATKLLPLADVLNERLLISGDALRHINSNTFLGRVPVVVDHLKFDARSWSKVSRRGSVFVFSVPRESSSAAEVRNIAARQVQSYTVNDARKDDARTVTEGFRMMVEGQYIDADVYFRRSAERSYGQSTNRTIARMSAIASAIAEVQRIAPDAPMAPYYRGECPLFDASLDEQVEFRKRQQQDEGVNNNSMTSVEDALGDGNDRGGRRTRTASASIMERSYSGADGIRDNKKGGGDKKKKRSGYNF